MTKETKDKFMFTLGGIIMIAFFIILGLLIFHSMPTDNKDVLYLIIGALIGFASNVVNYFYGSSKGSADKTDILNKKTDNPNP
jgi:drug/metabolite transporter (DMT)-like permease